jgi:dCTP diphosphatase
MDALDDIRQRIRAFCDARDWRQFHTPKNLAASISIEAAELLEVFQWCGDQESQAVAKARRAEVADEVADVGIYLIEFAEIVGIDLVQAIRAKLDRNESRYPVDKARGRADKWSSL